MNFARRIPGGTVLITVASLAFATVVLAVPALWNGFPLLYWDSYDYIGLPFGADLPMFRSASYSIITVLGALTGTLWVPVAAQCLLIALILHETLAMVLPWPLRWTLPVTALGMLALTAEPWFTSQLMADCFTAPLILGLGALAFRAGRLPIWRRLVLVVVLAIAITVHTSHLALVTGLVAAFLFLRGLGWAGVGRWLAPRPVGPIVALALGAGMAISTNWAVTGLPFLGQSTDILMLARLVQDGIAKRYLTDTCPHGATFRLCAHIAELPDNANQFLWTPGPFYKVGGWTPAMQAEARAIVRGSLFAYPLMHIKSAINLTIEQLIDVETGDGVIRLDTIHADGDVKRDPFLPKVIAQYYPGDITAYWASRQRQNIDFKPINDYQVPLVYLGYLLIFVALGYGVYRRDRLSTGLALTVILAILGNAFICGALSNPNDRYQARIGWTALFAVGIAVARAKKNDQSRCIAPDVPL